MCSVALVLIYFQTWFEHVLVLFRAVWLFLLRKSSELKQTNQTPNVRLWQQLLSTVALQDQESARMNLSALNQVLEVGSSGKFLGEV